MEQKIALTRILIYNSNSSWLYLPVASLLMDFKLRTGSTHILLLVCVCVPRPECMHDYIGKQFCILVARKEGDKKATQAMLCEVTGGCRQIVSFPSVSPLNLNLLVPHGMSQPSMGLCFASEARCHVLSERALLRQSFMCVFLTSHMVCLDAQADIQLLLFILMSC